MHKVTNFMTRIIPPPAPPAIYDFDKLEPGEWVEVLGRATRTVSVAVSRWHKRRPEKRLMVRTRHDGVVIVRRVY